MVTSPSVLSRGRSTKVQANLKMDEIVARLGLKPGNNVADIGAGSGLFEVPFAKAVPRRKSLRRRYR